MPLKRETQPDVSWLRTIEIIGATSSKGDKTPDPLVYNLLQKKGNFEKITFLFEKSDSSKEIFKFLI